MFICNLYCNPVLTVTGFDIFRIDCCCYVVMNSPSSEEDCSENDSNRIFKGFKCFKCKKIFTTDLYRFEHFRQVHCKKKYMLTCSQCRRKFSQCDELLVHLNASHKMITNDDSFD